MLKRLVLIVCFFLPMVVCAEEFIAGKDYADLGARLTHKPIAVTEFFSYGCPGCFRLQPAVTKWQQDHKTTIKFNQIPVVFHKEWDYYARAFYLAQSLTKNAELDPILFKAIHTDKIPLNSKKSMTEFLTAQGLNKELVMSAFTDSTTMDLQIANGNRKMAQFHITGVPAFIVNHRYKTDLQMATSEERLFKILDFLVAKSNQE